MGVQQQPPLVSKPRQPKPVSEARRIRKPLMERKRRERINTSLNDLASLLAEAHLVKGEAGKPTKLEKADILELTVKHMKTLRDSDEDRTDGSDSAVNSYRDGFTRCMNVVEQALGKAGKEALRERLLCHLKSCLKTLQLPTIRQEEIDCQTANQDATNRLSAVTASSGIKCESLVGLKPEVGTPESATSEAGSHITLVPTRMPSGGVCFLLQGGIDSSLLLPLEGEVTEGINSGSDASSSSSCEGVVVSPVSSEGSRTTSSTQCPPISTSTQCPPISTSTQCPPSLTFTQCPPTSTSTQCPPTSTSTQCPSTSTSTQCPPSLTSTQCPPTSTSTQCPPTSTSTQCPPSLTSTQCPPISTSTQCPPISTSTQCPPSLTSTQCPPSLTSTQCPPSLTSTQCLPSLTSTQCPPTSTSTQCPPSLTSTQCLPSLTSTQCPPTSTSTQCPPISTSTQCQPTSTSTQCSPTPSFSTFQSASIPTQTPSTYTFIQLEPTFTSTQYPLTSTSTPTSIPTSHQYPPTYIPTPAHFSPTILAPTNMSIVYSPGSIDTQECSYTPLNTLARTHTNHESVILAYYTPTNPAHAPPTPPPSVSPQSFQPPCHLQESSEDDMETDEEGDVDIEVEYEGEPYDLSMRRMWRPW
ncbi:uncharacterized protein [Procambarus clarkii]|uniref:uncharacterized protein n=1 Tax=Procambarus clarkii TaxID=6728 RepID=UPI001E671BBA|nr:mucin-2-like [Procambarus clarkii]